MAEHIIQIPTKGFVEAKEFPNNEFPNHTLTETLANCQADGRHALFMPEIVDARIALPKDSRIWQNSYSATSVRVAGRSRQGNAVVVYAHVPNYFSNPENIKASINQGLRNGASKIPNEEFQRLLDLEDGKSVFVVDYEVLRNASDGVISTSKALKHPQTIPFLGGQERAEAYLDKHEKVFGRQIGVWHSDDLADKPLGRLLFVGNDFDSYLYGGNLYYYGRFLGVRENVAEGGARQIKAPSLEQVLIVSDKYVPQTAKAEFEKELRKLYK